MLILIFAVLPQCKLYIILFFCL